MRRIIFFLMMGVLGGFVASCLGHSQAVPKPGTLRARTLKLIARMDISHAAHLKDAPKEGEGTQADRELHWKAQSREYRLYFSAEVRGILDEYRAKGFDIKHHDVVHAKAGNVGSVHFEIMRNELMRLADCLDDRDNVIGKLP